MRDLLKPVVTNCPMGCQLMVVNFTQSNCFSKIQSVNLIQTHQLKTTTQ